MHHPLPIHTHLTTHPSTHTHTPHPPPPSLCALLLFQSESMLREAKDELKRVEAENQLKQAELNKVSQWAQGGQHWVLLLNRYTDSMR